MLRVRRVEYDGELGNIVQFGTKDKDNYIFNPRTEEKVMMRRKGRRYDVVASFIRKGRL